MGSGCQHCNEPRRSACHRITHSLSSACCLRGATAKGSRLRSPRNSWRQSVAKIRIDSCAGYTGLVWAAAAVSLDGSLWGSCPRRGTHQRPRWHGAPPHSASILRCLLCEPATGSQPPSRRRQSLPEQKPPQGVCRNDTTTNSEMCCCRTSTDGTSESPWSPPAETRFDETPCGSGKGSQEASCVLDAASCEPLSKGQVTELTPKSQTFSKAGLAFFLARSRAFGRRNPDIAGIQGTNYMLSKQKQRLTSGQPPETM